MVAAMSGNESKKRFRTVDGALVTAPTEARGASSEKMEKAMLLQSYAAILDTVQNIFVPDMLQKDRIVQAALNAIDKELSS